MSQRTVLAVYDDRATAKDVVKALVDSGYDKDKIGLMARVHKSDGFVPYDSPDIAELPEIEEVTHPTGATSATAGGVLGGATGVALALWFLTVPGVGPALIAGPLAGLLVGTATGAVTGGLVGSLIEAGVPEEEAHLHSEAVKRGSTMVSLACPQARANAALEILQRFDPVDLKKRSHDWMVEGWDGFDTAKPPTTEELLAGKHQLFPTSNPLF